MDSDSTWSETSLDLSINLFPPNRQSPRRAFGGVELKLASSSESSSSRLAMEVDRMSSETKRLTQLMNSVKENCCLLRTQVTEWKSKNLERETPNSKKRKAEREHHHNNHCTESSSSDEDSSCKRRKDQKSKTKVSRVFVRTDASDASMAVKDGYQWRKYGQKGTRDNPSPRAYYKCSFFPTCPVKKKVQRSAEDPSVLIAVYEGQHNHTETSRNEFSLPQNLGAHLTSSLPPLTRPLSSSVFASSGSDSVEAGSGEVTFHQFLVQQMASSLRSDPIFAAAVAEAISGHK